MPRSSTPVIAVIGASGYVGARLVDRLVAQGDRPILTSRSPATVAARWPALEARQLDLDNPATIAPALVGVDLVYYLAHAMDGGGNFAERERRAASAFGRAAHDAGVGRIIYLGGLGDPSRELSEHLASRQLTGALLGEAGVPVTELRAAIVVGSGSASFEILRHLVERLPVMVTPRWVRTRCQPIGIDDVLAYLLAARDHPEVTGIVEIGGADVQTYGSMMQGYARARGLRRLMLPVPVLTPRLSSYWVHLVSPIPAGLAGPLIEGLRHEVVVRDPGPASRLGVTPMSYREALARALDRAGSTSTSWFDERRAPRSALAGTEGIYADRRERLIRASPDAVFEVLRQTEDLIRWPSVNPLRLLRIREAVVRDAWRLEWVEPGRRLRRSASRGMFGRAWLQFEILPVAEGTRLVQTAFFEPRGLAGLVYWFAIYPFARTGFRAILRELARRAERPARGGSPSQGEGTSMGERPPS